MLKNSFSFYYLFLIRFDLCKSFFDHCHTIESFLIVQKFENIVYFRSLTFEEYVLEDESQNFNEFGGLNYFNDALLGLAGSKRT